MEQDDTQGTNQSKHFSSDFRVMVAAIRYNSLGFFFLEFLIPYIATQHLDVGGLGLGLLFSLRIIGYMLSSTFVGYLADHMPKKPLVVVGSVGRGLAYMVLYLAIVGDSFVWMALGTTALGFMAGFFWIPLNVLVSEKSVKSHRSKAFGYRSRAEGTGVMIGSTVGFTIFIMAVAQNLSPFITYLGLPLFGLANIYAAVLFWTRVQEDDVVEHQEISTKSVKATKSPKIRTTVLSWVVVGMAGLMMAKLFSSINGSLAKPFMVAYLLENVIADAQVATLVYIPSGIVSMVMAPKLGELADRISPYLGLSVGSVVGAVVTFLLVNTADPVIFALLLMIDSTAVTTTSLILVKIISDISKAHRGAVFGLESFVTNFGAILGPLVGGLMWDSYGAKAPFYFSIGVEIALVPLFLFSIYQLLPRRKDEITSEYLIQEKDPITTAER